ncbi:hypothetical protein D3C72_825790 [compost metagenome]
MAGVQILRHRQGRHQQARLELGQQGRQALHQLAHGNVARLLLQFAAQQAQLAVRADQDAVAIGHLAGQHGGDVGRRQLLEAVVGIAEFADLALVVGAGEGTQHGGMVDDLLHPPVAVAEFKMRFDLLQRNAALLKRSDQALQLRRNGLLARLAPYAPRHQELLVMTPARQHALNAFQRTVGIRCARQCFGGFGQCINFRQPVLYGAPRIPIRQQRLAQRRTRLQEGAVFTHQRLQARAQVRSGNGIARHLRDRIGKARRPLLMALDLFPIRGQTRIAVLQQALRIRLQHGQFAVFGVHQRQGRQHGRNRGLVRPLAVRAIPRQPLADAALGEDGLRPPGRTCG